MVTHLPSNTPDHRQRSHHVAERIAAQLHGSFSSMVVCGSGLSGIVDEFDVRGAVPMDQVGLPVSSVPGHTGVLYWCRIGDADVLVAAGRVHLYEGYSVDETVMGVRAGAHLGVGELVISNAAGSLRREWVPGQLVAISDHVNLTGVNPLTGSDAEPYGRTRFIDMSCAYSPELRELVAGTLPEGVYAALRGPSYETPAEIAMLRSFGVDLVGMSTVNETIAAKHLGLAVLGVSMVSNYAAGMAGTLHHEEVAAVARGTSDDFARLVAGLCSR
jgi:purine-nucleoside phosphorylase